MGQSRGYPHKDQIPSKPPTPRDEKRTKIHQSLTNPLCAPGVSPGSTPGKGADKCISQEGRGLKSSNFTVILEIPYLSKQAVGTFINDFSGPKSCRGFRERNSPGEV